MSALHELVRSKLSYWPDELDLICVSRRKDWMLSFKDGTDPETRSFLAKQIFSQLGRCSSLYSGGCKQKDYRK